jgi:cell fate regulator YaaT (PSP1 superfamily)
METNIEENTNYNESDSGESVENDNRYTEGQVLKFIRVRFPGHAKSYPFLIGKRKLMYGQKVMAMSDRGLAVGYINSFPYDVAFKKDMLPLKSISKVATAEDIATEKDTYKKQKETETLCQRLIDKHNLQMNLTHVEFTGYGKKVVFYFIAPARVDFRGLVRDLVAELKLRIELRQISVRDRSASMGALGPCGRELCCSSFLTKYGNVSVKMAKNQNLTLNYSKLNGVCGQLKCCLQYEDDVYSAKRKKMPDEGNFIQTSDGRMGKVLRIHILSEQFDMLTNQGHIRRYVASRMVKKIKMEEANMPRKFDHISDETSTIIGLSEQEAETSIAYKKDMDELTGKAHKYAFDTFYDLTGVDKPEYEMRDAPPETGKKVLEINMPSIADVAEAKKNSDIQAKSENYTQNDKINEDYKSENGSYPINSEATPDKEEEKKPPAKKNNRNRNRNRNKNRNKSTKPES